MIWALPTGTALTSISGTRERASVTPVTHWPPNIPLIMRIVVVRGARWRGRLRMVGEAVLFTLKIR